MSIPFHTVTWRATDYNCSCLPPSSERWRLQECFLLDRLALQPIVRQFKQRAVSPSLKPLTNIESYTFPSVGYPQPGQLNGRHHVGIYPMASAKGLWKCWPCENSLCCPLQKAMIFSVAVPRLKICLLDAINKRTVHKGIQRFTSTSTCTTQWASSLRARPMSMAFFTGMINLMAPRYGKLLT